MSLTDDQQMEYDLLTAMYPEHVSEVRADGKSGLPQYHIDVSVEIDTPTEIRLTLTLPAEYPAEAVPQIQVESISTTRRVQTAALLTQLKTSAEENLGMHCGAVLLQAAQEFMRDLDSGNKKEEDAVEVDPTIRLGHAVTRELFDDWRLKHRKEKDEKLAIEEKKLNAAKAGKLSGKQLWDKTIKEADWELFGGEADAEDGEDIEYDFADEGDEPEPEDDEAPADDA